MKMNRKGMEMPLVLVVGAVVLIVISLIVISITSGGLTKFFGTTTQTSASAETGIKSEYKSTLEQLDTIGKGGTTANAPPNPDLAAEEEKTSEEKICEQLGAPESCSNTQLEPVERSILEDFGCCE